MVAVLAQVHLVAGFVLIGLLLAVAVVGFAAFRRPRPYELYFKLHTYAAILLAIEVALGLLLIALGRRPASFVHYLYGLTAIATMPIARAMISANPARAKWYHLGATVFLFGLLVRLATTG